MIFGATASSEGGEQEGAQKREPCEQVSEIVAGGGGDGVAHGTGGVLEEAAAHTAVGLQMAETNNLRAERRNGGAVRV